MAKDDWKKQSKVCSRCGAPYAIETPTPGVCGLCVLTESLKKES